MVVYRRETLAEIKPDIVGLLQDHWEELASFKEYEVEVDWPRYEALDAAGKLVAISARDDGKLVGYVVDILGSHLHYKSMLVANSDVHFLKPEYRAKCALGMTRFVEKIEKDLGVFVRINRTKDFNSAGRFFKAVGYEVVETVWGKRL